MNANIAAGAVMALLIISADEAVGVPPDPCGTGPYLTAAQLITTLNGKYVCAQATNGDRWNEFHRGTGAGPFPIIDYKRGPNHPIDPSKPVGTYKVNESGPLVNTVTYDYGTGGTYTYKVKAALAPSSSTPAHLFCPQPSGAAIPAVISDSPTISTLCQYP